MDYKALIKSLRTIGVDWSDCYLRNDGSTGWTAWVDLTKIPGCKALSEGDLDQFHSAIVALITDLNLPIRFDHSPCSIEYVDYFFLSDRSLAEDYQALKAIDLAICSRFSKV